MAKVLNLPEIAESVVEGEIVKWLKKENDFVKKNEPLVEVMTEKVTVEIPSPFEGILAKIVAPEGSVIPVHKPIAVFAEAGENPEDIDFSSLLGEETVMEKTKEQDVLTKNIKTDFVKDINQNNI